MNAAQQMADWLVSQGIEQVFAVTGGGSMFINHALASHPGLRCTFMHHEQACAMAAEGYARIAGKPAVVNVTTGPGGINALNGVFGAYTDSIPMLVLSAQVKRETCLDFVPVPGLRQLGDQEGPVVHMARHVTKFAEVARSAEDLGRLLPMALSAACQGRPGPAWIDVPLDVQSARTPVAFDPLRAAPPAGDELAASCATILDRLALAHRPVILAGSGVRISDATDTLLAFAEAHGIPVATAWAHDLIASDHPLCAGRPGTIGTRGGNFCLQAADLVLVVGSRLNIRQVSYNWISFAKNAFVVQVDIDAAEFAKPFVKAGLSVCADARRFLRELGAAAATRRLPDYSSWAQWCRAIQARYPALQPSQTLPPRLNPYFVVDYIFRLLRDSDVIVSGNASACIVPFQVGRLQMGQRMFSNSGAASMGYDLPAALGAATADHKRRVICFAGDGSLQMNVQELQTLKTSGANVIVVVLANNGYLSIRLSHENFFGTVIGATPESGVDFPDYSALATAFGLPAAKILTHDDLKRLARLLDGDGPAVVQIAVDSAQAFEPRLKSRIGDDGKFLTPELDDMFPFLPPDELAAVRLEAAAIRANATVPKSIS
jgi:acetolactate synthase-1/2/3 large subunit